MGAGASGNSHHVGFVSGSKQRAGRSNAPTTSNTRLENDVHSHGNVTPGSQLCTVADEQSIQLSEDSNSACTLTHAQQRNVRLCLGALEEGLSVAIRLEDVLQQLLFSQNTGKLTSRPRRATVLCVPHSVVHESLERAPSKEEMLQWCARRSYVDTGIFDSGVLSCKTIEFCLKASFMSVLSEESLHYLAGLVVPVMFGAGDMLYRSGDEPDCVYFVLRGAVECSSTQKPHLSKSITNSAEGYVVGREGFFDRTKRSHSARALGPLLVAPIGHDALQQVILKHPTESSKIQTLLNAVT
ncbi:hypothetical protein EMCRGX_G034546 [Ephydatia muelleri]